MRRSRTVLLAVAVVLAGLLAFGGISAFGAASAGSEDALVSALAKNGDVKLTKSLTLNSCVTVPSGVKVTLDLNGKTLARHVSSAKADGSVIAVEQGATLTVKDTSGNNAGSITGGFALTGGGIQNGGACTIEGGTITGNKALDNTLGLGGGIYNADGATLTIKGGVVSLNDARNGGGIYNAPGGKVYVLEGSYIKAVGNIQNKIIDNVKIRGNSAEGRGGGVFNASEFYIQDSPLIAGNNTDTNGDDVFLAGGAALTLSGALKNTEKIPLRTSGTNPVVVKDYSKYSSDAANEHFVSSVSGYAILLDESGNLTFKTDSKTTVQSIKDGKVTKTESYDNPEDAWNAGVSAAAGADSVEIVLGSDWIHDKSHAVGENNKVTLDLNGHFVQRTRNGEQISGGELFLVSPGATFTVRDSSPKSKGFDGIAGGVLTGGASGNGGGCIQVKSNATFSMEGGTIYRCTTDDEGGAVKIDGDNATLSMKNCRVYFCQTVDSRDSCNGGGIYIAGKHTNATLENMTFQDCYSEDDGGAVYVEATGRVNLKMKGVTFCGNRAVDNGGAIFYNNSGANQTVIDASVEDCRFVGNSASGYGGGAYIAGHSEAEALPSFIFKRCRFSDNYAKECGGAVLADYRYLVIYDTEIYGNRSGKSGAVFVRETRTVTFGGLCKVEGNSSGREGSNVKLYDSSENSNIAPKIESMGLYSGSYLGLTPGSKENVVSRHMTEEQMRCIGFESDSGELKYSKTETIETPVVTASIFGDGSAALVAALAAGFAALGCTAVVYKKRKDGAANDKA